MEVSVIIMAPIGSKVSCLAVGRSQDSETHRPIVSTPMFEDERVEVVGNECAAQPQEGCNITQPHSVSIRLVLSLSLL